MGIRRGHESRNPAGLACHRGGRAMSEELFLGVDLTAGQRPWTLMALDRDLRIAEKRSGPAESILEFLQSLEPAVVAIDAPAAPNRGRMRQAAVRRRLGMTARGERWADWRVCEVELRRQIGRA